MAGLYLNSEGEEVKVPDYGIYSFGQLQSQLTTDLVKFTCVDNAEIDGFIDIGYPFDTHEKNKAEGWVVPVIKDSKIDWDHAVFYIKEFINNYKGGPIQ